MNTSRSLRIRIPVFSLLFAAAVLGTPYGQTIEEREDRYIALKLTFAAEKPPPGAVLQELLSQELLWEADPPAGFFSDPPADHFS